MTLEQIRNEARKAHEAKQAALQAEIARRKTIILDKLATWGINPGDDWTLTPEGPDQHGIFISHPDLELPAFAVLSDDGQDQLYIANNASPWQPTDAWDIAKYMGATL